MLLSLLLLACTSTPEPPSPAGAIPSTPPSAPAAQPAVQPAVQPANPPMPPSGPGGSGAAMQDPTGFPPFHDWPAPQGPAVPAGGAWSAPVKLTSKPGGGYRPQIAAGVNGIMHALYYERTDEGDLIRHRQSRDGMQWGAPVHLGHHENRNWGPDIVARPDGSLVVVYDHALADFRSRGFLTTYTNGRWSEPQALTPDDGGEVGSGHVANASGNDLAYVWIGKTLDPNDHFQARSRWFSGGKWQPIVPLTDGKVDAWHTNVERRPDGSLLAGWDVGMGGAETRLFVAEGKNGRFGTPEDISATSHAGERVHFAFGPDGTDHLTWFHKVHGRPQHIYVRSGRPGRWGPTATPAKGYGGFHFDPDIAVNSNGVLCLVWGWDAGAEAELVYSLNQGNGWSAPARVAQIGWGKPGLASLDVDAQGRFHVIWNQGVRGYNEVYTARLEVK